MTNRELANVIYTEGTKNLPPEVLEHVALRFIELFRDSRTFEALDVTYVPFVA